jgi:5-bromo-4-chloroindolyl phosphate hydrolysis protein
MAGKKGSKKSESKFQNLDKAIGPASEFAINTIAKDYPAFAGSAPYIASHIDKRRVTNKFYELYGQVKDSNKNYGKKEEFIFNGIANYIASGEAFDDEGNEIIFGKGLNEKTGFFHRMMRRQRLKGERELNDKMRMMNEVYNLVTSNPEEYSKLAPEVMKRAVYLKRANLMQPLAKILKSHGNMGEREIKNFYKDVNAYARENIPEMKEEMKGYLRVEKNEEGSNRHQRNQSKLETMAQAAAILTFFGFGLILVRIPGITGSVINSSGLFSDVGSLIGSIILLLGIALFLVSRKYRRKNKCK